jgi:hypothetical protein
LAVLALSSLLIPDENVRIFAMAMSAAGGLWVGAARVSATPPKNPATGRRSRPVGALEF